MTQTKKYQRCMVFAGGGFRFGIYLGMYAAACDAGRKPDVLLASCGGAIAAAIIQSLSSDAERLTWLGSPEMYRFWCGLTSAPHASLAATLAQAAQRKLSRRAAPLIPDLFNSYLFDVPPLLPLPPAAPNPEVDVAIVGGKLLFRPDEVGQLRGQRKLFVQTVLCNARAAALLDGMPSPFESQAWGSHAIAAGVMTDSSMSVAEAARLSITDFYYFACHRHGGDYYVGGVVDLFPIEVAHRLADEVMLEFKESFDQAFSIPAWRAVLGLDGNQRLRYVNAQPGDVWFDTSDVSIALARQQVQKKIDWRRNRITLSPPSSHAIYMQHIQDQWDYGYQRGREALQRKSSGDMSGMRRVNRYNRPGTASSISTPHGGTA